MVRSASLDDLLGGDAGQGRRSGGLGVWYETRTPTRIKGEETDFVATVPVPPSANLPAKGSLFPHISKLVYSIPTDSLKDLLEDKKGFSIRHALIRQHPRVRMLTTHRDAHLYIFPHWVMQFIKENDRLESIGEDVIGWWAKAGWQKGLSAKLGLDGVLRGPGDDSDSEHATEPPTKDGPQGQTSQPPSKPGYPSSPSPHGEVPVPPMLAYIHPAPLPNPNTAPTNPPSNRSQPAQPPQPTGPIIRRVDTAQLLLNVSLQLAKLPSLEETGPDAPASPFSHARKIAYPEGVKPRTTITKADSLVADNVTVEEKTSIKECVIGAGCQIGEGAKLSQCLLMDGVVVGRNCKLTRCVVGKRAEIGEGCVLTECEVQENLLVEAKSKYLGFPLVLLFSLLLSVV